MARPRHPDKEIETAVFVGSAIKGAERAGCAVTRVEVELSGS